MSLAGNDETFGFEVGFQDRWSLLEKLYFSIE